MGNQGCWVEAGMLVLPRGTHRLPICVFACLAGTPSATDRLLHVCASNVNEACPAALLVLLHVRDYACHGCGARSWTQCTHTNACGTSYGRYTRLGGLVGAVPLIRFTPPLYVTLNGLLKRFALFMPVYGCSRHECEAVAPGFNTAGISEYQVSYVL